MNSTCSATATENHKLQSLKPSAKRTSLHGEHDCAPTNNGKLEIIAPSWYKNQLVTTLKCQNTKNGSIVPIKTILW